MVQETQVEMSNRELVDGRLKLPQTGARVMLQLVKSR